MSTIQKEMILCDIKRSVQTSETEFFKLTLSSCTLHLNDLCDSAGRTVFHILGSEFAKEKIALEFLDILEQEYKLRYSDQASQEIVKNLNLPTNDSKLTPLMIAVISNRKVINI
jgi:hypothetical protein